MKYTSFIHITFNAKDKNEMFEKLWDLEKLLEDNGYNVKANNTAPVKEMICARYGDYPL